MIRKLVIALLVFLAFVPRFWQLEGVADIVFDEVYYPKFAQNYLQGISFFDAHPPLGKYLIALGIKLFGYQPWGYRFMPALAGSLVPIVVFLFVKQWTKREFIGWLAGIFTALDSLLLVESRYGLINIFMVLFGLLSQYCLLAALQVKRQIAVWFWVISSGIFLGSSVSIKWTGLGYFLAGIALLVVVHYYEQLSLKWHQIIIGMVAIPAVFYLVQWLPHLLLDPSTSLITLHQQIFHFHQNLGDQSPSPLLAHPYCSQWWTWALMVRNIAYFFEFRNLGIVHVNGMGNPFLYWFSAGAVLYSLVRLKLAHQTKGLSLYLGIAFLGNLLPWMLAKRCSFLYHYMPASVFAFIALALIADLCFHRDLTGVGITIVAGVAIAFVIWLPIYIGLPIPINYWRMLIWFPTWI
ncbi:MAG: phospholipid carrier-dependent glycosyltransferase [Pseudanabaenaceae cyanobacterium]